MSQEDADRRQRKYPRVKEACEVKYRVIEDPVMQPERQGGVALNISGGGMCFSVEQELELGSMLAIELTLPELPTPVVSLARVVWCDLGDGAAKFDVGVEFWWIGWADTEAQGHMLRYINEKLDELGLNSSGEES